jgi:hypothetical protein
MYYVIQENLFREYGFQALIGHLDKLILQQGALDGPVGYEIAKYVPFSGKLEVKTKREDVFFFGSSSAGMAAKQHYNWTPGHFINENFTMEKYLPAFGEHMLNSDGRIMKPKELCEIVENLHLGLHSIFVRPVDDGKAFTGEVFTGSQWLQYAKNNRELEGIKILTASIKKTQQEIRCWIVDGEPVTISQYKIGSRGNYLNMDHNDEAIIFAKKMAKIYQPARAFCLDICLYNDDYFIVELGCINHCGFYDSNMGKLIDSIEKMKF